MTGMEAHIIQLASEQEYEVYEVIQFPFEEGNFLDLYICTKDHFEYFIIASIDFSLLKKVNNKIQIALFTKLRSHITDGSENKTENLSHFFEKNTTLIVVTSPPSSTRKEYVYKEVSKIEEDAYYFKKQVLFFNSEENIFFNDNLASYPTVSDYCSAIISDMEKYELFVIGLDNEFELISRLYEKVPFLNLSVVKHKPLNLDEMIEAEIDAEHLELRKEILKSITVDNMDEWISSIGASND